MYTPSQPEKPLLPSEILAPLETAAYRSRNLIICLSNFTTALELDQERLKAIFEMHVRKTEIKDEQIRNALITSWGPYRQTFEFTERANKVIYNALRQWAFESDASRTFDIEMYEPDASFTKVLDAWAITGVTLEDVRTSSIPARNLMETSDASVITSVVVKGDMRHHLTLMPRAQLELDRLNAAGISPAFVAATAEESDQ